MTAVRLFVILLLFTASVNAAVYQCKTTDDKVEFRDTPCQQGTQRLYHKSNAGPSAHTRVVRSQDFKRIKGPWCNFAISTTLTGAKDMSTTTQWLFGTEQLEVTTPVLHIQASYRQQQAQLSIGDKRLGNFQLLKQSAANMVMLGDYGYYFFRRGTCSP